MPMPDYVAVSMRRSIDEMLGGEPGSVLREAFRPLLERVFFDGVRIGLRLSHKLHGDTIQIYIEQELNGETSDPNHVTVAAANRIPTDATGREASRRPRGERRHKAAAGAVGQAIEIVLQ